MSRRVRVRIGGRPARGLPIALLVGWVLTACMGPAPGPRSSPAEADRWESDIRRFEQSDQDDPPPPGAVLFVGSSSIRLWDSLAEDFAGVPVLNRGFGGSEIADVLRFSDRIVLPYRPSVVVVYAGENDLAEGKSPERVIADFRDLVRIIHRELPEARIGFVSIKPSPSRWHLEAEMRRTNTRVRELSEGDPRLFYVDVFSAMLGADGRPREELFRDDRLHMNAEGYAIWTEAIRPHLDGTRTGFPPGIRRDPPRSGDTIPGIFAATTAPNRAEARRRPEAEGRSVAPGQGHLVPRRLSARSPRRSYAAPPSPRSPLRSRPSKPARPTAEPGGP